MAGRLYLIPVPLSETAPDRVLPAYNTGIVQTLRYFVVENLRSARRFLKSCDKSIGIDSLTMVELSEHTRREEVDAMLRPILDGADCGVISEAGCPGVADPGADIVALAQRHGIEVVPLVGPSSIIMGLMASGFNGQNFAFLGYLPIESHRRTAAIRDMQQRIARNSQTQIFIETPYRNNRLIRELAATLPSDMLLCVASDITGPRQSIVTRTVSAWARADYNYDKIPTIFLLYKA